MSVKYFESPTNNLSNHLLICKGKLRGEENRGCGWEMWMGEEESGSEESGWEKERRNKKKGKKKWKKVRVR